LGVTRYEMIKSHGYELDRVLQTGSCVRRDQVVKCARDLESMLKFYVIFISSDSQFSRGAEEIMA